MKWNEGGWRLNAGVDLAGRAAVHKGSPSVLLEIIIYGRQIEY